MLKCEGGFGEMVQYLVTYSIQTGREQEHGNWLCNVGMEYFKKQPGYHGFRSFSTLVGSGPDWVCEIEFDTADNLMKALESQEAQGILEDFEHLVTDLSTKILVPTSTPVGMAA